MLFVNMVLLVMVVYKMVVVDMVVLVLGDMVVVGGPVVVVYMVVVLDMVADVVVNILLYMMRCIKGLQAEECSQVNATKWMQASDCK